MPDSMTRRSAPSKSLLDTERLLVGQSHASILFLRWCRSEGTDVGEQMLLVSAVQFHSAAVPVDRDDTHQAAMGILPEPVREPVRQGKAQLVGWRRGVTRDDPQPAAHVVCADL